MSAWAHLGGFPGVLESQLTIKATIDHQEKPTWDLKMQSILCLSALIHAEMGIISNWKLIQDEYALNSLIRLKYFNKAVSA